MNKPVVSVIIPAYNCAGSISKAIDSVLSQNVTIEVIVLDDCSNDNLDFVMKKYQDKDNLKYIKNEKNLGAAETRNKGVTLASGEYVAFLDGDDYWDERKLQKQLTRIKETKTVLCSTARELLTSEGTCTGRVISVKEIITYKDLLKHNSINCSSVLLKTDIAREFPMHHEDSHEDYIMWLKILKKYKKASAVNEPLLKYRLSDKGKSGSKLHSAKMTFKVYRYMGFGLVQSMMCFVSYAIHGVLKYSLSRLENKIYESNHLAKTEKG